jgi:tetratricopeptide (TPR) repeat protein
MRTSWILSFAAVCGMGAFVYTLTAGSMKGRGSEAGAGGPSLGTFRAVALPDTIEELKGMVDGSDPRVRRVGRVWFRLARLYDEADREEDARHAWEETARLRLADVEQQRENYNAWFEAGWSLWKLGRMDDARPALIEAEKLLTDMPHERRDGEAWHRLAWSRRLLGDEPEAQIAWARARDFAQANAPLWSGDGMYDLACYQALLGEKSDALKSLERAVNAGWNRPARTMHDEDLESIRGDPKFLELVSKMKQSPDRSPVGPG